MRYHELLESSREVVRQANALAQQYGLKVTLQADGPQEIDLTWIERITGSPGNGAKFMTDLTKLADQHGIRIMLAVMGGEPRLIEFYKQFGFELLDEADDEDPVMERQPKTS